MPISGSYFTAVMKQPIGLSTGRRRSLAEIEKILARDREAYLRSNAGFGDRAPVADAIQTVIGWDKIYEPHGWRVISPVSRIWSVGWGGTVLSHWET